MLVKNNLFLLFYLSSVLMLLIYLYGFFPLHNSSVFKIRKDQKNELNYGHRIIDKLALIVIDALRFDFIKPENHYRYMPFTLSSIIKNESCLIPVRAHSPTVTLPRIKAITSGTVSSFIDVVLNFFSSNIEEENFISTASSKGLKLVFYGDDTWLKLFPTAFFRSEGTNSFFTLDFTEVDENVTRHLNNEFSKSDWDVIILHYLGLDHIGHVEGPFSPFVKPKLAEMDQIILKFASYFKLLEEKGLQTLLLVTSDHGMKDSGSHGGVTYPEITVPLVSVGKPCYVLPGWPIDEIPSQVDIAPTISALLGLPLPRTNVGKIIPSILHGVKVSEIMNFLHQNALQLQYFENFTKNDNCFLEMQEKRKENGNGKIEENKFEKKVKYCYNFLKEKSETKLKLKLEFNLSYLIFGGICLCLVLILFVSYLPKPQGADQRFLLIGTILHAISFISTSFIEEEHQTWYFFWSTFCLLMLFQTIKNQCRVRDILPWIFICFLHRFLRKLNQTGDKWASVPDIKFFLNSSDGQMFLFPFFLLGMGLTFLCGIVEKCSLQQIFTFGMSLLSIVCFKLARGTFIHKFLLFYPSSSGQLEMLMFWVFSVVFTIQVIHSKSSKHLMWLVFASLLMRPHNTILLPAQVFISKQIHKKFKDLKDVFWNDLAHIWLGNTFYFYQGNGNSLSNVDVASGFVGIKEYNPLYAAFMISAHTSTAHILSFILSPKCYLAHTASRIIPVTIYCLTLIFQLQHLFIWSVFSPKLLYESYFTFILFILILFNSFSQIYIHKTYFCKSFFIKNLTRQGFFFFHLKQ